MRLICPNCDAQYEVEDAAIPEAGRDVQCSNCGHAWFQLPPEVEAALAEEEELFGSPAAGEGEATGEGGDAAPTAAERRDGDAEEDEDAEEGWDEPPASATGPAAPPADAPRRTLDDSVMSVLREEAEREAAQRRGEGSSAVETQADLGLEEPPRGARPSLAARERISQLKGMATDPEAEADLTPGLAKASTRRDLLPDIDEINSSLRASSERRAAGLEDIPEPAPEPERSGFRTGFVLMMVLAVALVAGYALAPRIVAQLPAAAGTMDAYVATVDAARLWLDGVMQQAIALINGTGSETGQGS